MADDAREITAAHEILRLWPDGPPSRIDGVGPEADFRQDACGVETTMLRNVSDTTLTVYRPAPGRANGVGVIVCPGGGWRILAWEHEGVDVAQWLAERGYTAFLLKYRLGPTPVDAAAFVKAHLSKDAAKKLRKKRQKLESMGAVAHVVARDETTARRILDAFFEQKLARFREKNIESVFETAEARAFMDSAALAGLEDGAPALELQALTLDDRTIATYGGGVHRGRLHLMVNSFDGDIEIARCSPGDLLLQSIIEAGCAAGLTSFDLGIGEARYKDSWCDESVAMFDSIMPVSAKGRIYAHFESLRLNAKRWVKQSDWAWPLLLRLLRRG